MMMGGFNSEMEKNVYVHVVGHNNFSDDYANFSFLCYWIITVTPRESFSHTHK
jgi:hypothetical protein